MCPTPASPTPAPAPAPAPPGPGPALASANTASCAQRLIDQSPGGVPNGSQHADGIDDATWARFQRDGYVRLGKVVSDDMIQQLQERIDAIMLGDAPLDYSRMLMQLDSDNGAYGDLSVQSSGHKGATLGYRKIQDLELDPLFRSYLAQPIFQQLCQRVYGSSTPVDVYRAMFMNKPAGKGTVLPWHQDRWPRLDRDPQVTVWTALDPATIANGCVNVIPGSHHAIINPDHPSGFLTPEMAAEHCPADQQVALELEAGEAVVLHNWLLHGSQVNTSATSRRAFSVCYMDGNTTMRTSGEPAGYRRIWPAEEAFDRDGASA